MGSETRKKPVSVTLQSPSRWPLSGACVLHGGQGGWRGWSRVQRPHRPQAEDTALPALTPLRLQICPVAQLQRRACDLRL